MVQASTSAAGVRFLSSIKEGRGLKRSAREAGVHPEMGYRWLRETYLAHRRSGLGPVEAEALLGFSSARSVVWDAEVGQQAAASRAGEPTRSATLSNPIIAISRS